MNIFISGGCKNGKSHYAQEVAQKMACECPLYYLATMIPHDNEDRARIERHIAEREGWGFITIEQGTDILKALDQEGVDSKGVFLLDSVTALLQNEMFADIEGELRMNLQAAEKVAKDLEEFAKRTGNTVFVSDNIFSDARRFDEITEKYREGLALCDKTLARVCDKAVEVAFGSKIEYK